MFFNQPIMQALQPVVQLPKMTTPTAADLAAKANSPPAAQALVKPGMTSGEYVHALEQNKQPVDAVNALAHGMPERHSVWWATQSSQKVANKLNPQELAANQAAEAWVKNPTEANQAAAAQAASKTDFKGPGGWAAQAAAWSKSPGPAPQAATGAPGAASANAPAAGAPAMNAAAGAASMATAPALTPAAVAGAVLLAAGLVSRPAMSAPQKPDLQMPQVTVPQVEPPAVTQPQMPVVDQSKLATPLKPFIDLGKDVASGKNTWA